MKKNKFSCFLLGEESLLIQCAKKIMDSGHLILGVVSSNEQIKKWTHANKLRFISATENFEPILFEVDFDYLFSIVNKKILSTKLLKKPRKIAINYHDALLPRYAGLHATSWAIVNNEKEHGISWHIMEDIVDSGDVLKQAKITVDPEDTALSLNLKCYEAAINVFSELIDELTQNISIRKKQDLGLRTYYSSNKKILGNGWINWDLPAEEIYRLYRALSFGNYPNGLGVIKCLIGDEVYVIENMSLKDSMTNMKAGTIIKANNLLEVTTVTENIVISKIKTVKGESVDIASAIKKHKIKAGNILYYPDTARQNLYQLLSEKISKCEKFWLNELLNIKPANLPFVSRIDKTYFPNHKCLFSIKIKSELETLFEHKHSLSIKKEDLLTAALLIYFYRIGNQENLSIAINNSAFSDSNADIYQLIAAYLPFSLTMSDSMSFVDVVNSCFAKRIEIQNNLSYQHDIYCRYPELNNTEKNIFISILTNIKEKNEFSINKHYPINFIINNENISLYVAKEILNSELGNFCASMAGQLKCLLKTVNEKPTEGISLLPLLTPAEYQQIVYDWNQTKTDYPSNKTIHQLFEEQVERTPNNIALVFGEQKLTYKALNEKANQLAYCLQQYDVKSETPVAVCLNRTVDVAISLLAVLKAGGVYVPLDTSYPVERLKLIINDVGADICITQEIIAKNFIEVFTKVKNIVQLDNNKSLKKYPTENLIHHITLDNTAYMIYTSGSTGKPKGVMLLQRTLSNLIHWEQKHYILAPCAKTTQLASIGFDVSVEEILYALLSGYELHIVPDEVKYNINSLVAWVAEEKINRLFLPTALLEPFAVESNQLNINIEQLQDITVAGEALKITKAIKQFFAVNSHISLSNEYGPSETHVVTSYQPNFKQAEPLALIGKPIANTQLYIVDSNFNPVSVGVVGELYLGGDNVAKGYLNRDELTSEKFINNPLNPDSKTRLYKTGDLCRYLPDGNIEYIGRSDFQVKIRGFRIELGEIETALSKYQAIKGVTVQAREDVPGNKYLAAYFITQDNNPINTNELKNYLAKTLPDYMVPTAFMQLEVFPLTPNGKLDRKSLPVPEITSSKIFIAPRTDTEKAIASIWQEVLNIAQIGVLDNFFELGGHSLLATQVTSRILHDLKQTVSLQEFFRTPTVEHLAELINNNEKTVDDLPLRLTDRNKPVPLSFAQQRLWFLDQLEPNSPLYNIPLVLQLTGDLNIQAFETALNQLVAQHEILRTQFVLIDNQPVQQIIKELNIQLTIHDLMKSADKENLAKEIIQSDILQPFVLSEVPLLRAQLIQMNEKESLFILNIHHSICDGWSLPIILGEISAFYNARITGTKLNLPELPVQYADFSVWQRDYLKDGSKVLTQQLQYWQTQLADVSTVLELPSDKPRPTVLSTTGANEYFVLSKSVSKRLNILADQTGTTLFMVLLSAFYVLLYRYTGQMDIVIGSPIANRNRKEIEPLIGFFVNTLALRGKLTHNLSFEALLFQVKQTTLEAYDHQDLPFEQLIEHLRLERDLSRNALIQVMLILQNNTEAVMNLNEVDVKNTEVNYPIAKFDLTLNLVETEAGIKGTFNYATALFEADTIKRLVQHWQTLVEDILTHPTKEISQLQVLTPAEYQQIVYDWNQTETDYPSNKTIHQLFEEQVERTPNNIALVFGEQKLTYKELNERANQLAHYLRHLDVKTDTLIGICLERSLNLLVSILGVLKAGAGYVPLDVDYPLERLNFILSDINALAVITNDYIKNRLDNYSGYKITENNYKDIEITDNPLQISKSEHLVYAIYTSGSTGKPKGVLIEHRQLINYAYGMLERLQPKPMATYAWVSTVAADLGNTMLFASLLTGGTLHVVSAEIAFDAERMSDYFVKNKIDYLKITPSHFNALLNTSEPQQVIPKLGLVLGGEASEINLINTIKSLSPNTKIFNHYGPTETTVGVLMYDTTNETRTSLTRLPLGKPLNNSRCYILDEALNPVLPGATGELYIGGEGLARGYLHQDNLTIQRFIQNPFATEKDKKLGRNPRLYKTGDLCRYLPDGNIEYIGRSDFQVKIRGFRIELGEIENALLKHAAIKEVTVQAREDVPGNKYLAAYFIARDNNPINTSELKSYLVETLPDYMVPTAFMQLEVFPLTPNGKLDRKSLPVPEITSSKVFIAPQTDTEKAITSIWQEVLKIDHIGVLDNFFELGGHSLLSTQVVSRIQNQLGYKISLSEFFQKPTISSLAELTATRNKIDQAELIIKKIDRNKPVPLSFAQERLWFLDQLEPDSPLYNTPIVLHLTGKVDLPVLSQALNTLVQRHEILRTCFVTVDEKPMQKIIDNLKIDINFVDLTNILSVNQSDNIKQEITAELLVPFKLSEIPLLRAKLIHVKNEEYIFIINMHHVLTDEWSHKIILQEICAIYNAKKNNSEINLPPLNIQYADYAFWQRDYLNPDNEIYQKQMFYWLQQLDSAPELLNLPTDRPRVSQVSYEGAVELFELPVDLSEKIKQLAEQKNMTLFMLLLAAFYLLLYRHSGDKDLVVGSPIANRHPRETESIIGFFVNTLALRIGLDDELTVSELLRKVREITLFAYDNQDIPFEKIVEKLNIKRELSFNPLFQVMLVVQKINEINVFPLQGVKSEFEKLNYNLSRFDLTLSLVETETNLKGSVSYKTSLFDKETVERLIEHLQVLLTGMVTDQTALISEMSLLSEAEQEALLIKLNSN